MVKFSLLSFFITIQTYTLASTMVAPQRTFRNRADAINLQPLQTFKNFGHPPLTCHGGQLQDSKDSCEKEKLFDLPKDDEPLKGSTLYSVFQSQNENAIDVGSVPLFSNWLEQPSNLKFFGLERPKQIEGEKAKIIWKEMLRKYRFRDPIFKDIPEGKLKNLLSKRSLHLLSFFKHTKTKDY